MKVISSINTIQVNSRLQKISRAYVRIAGILINPLNQIVTIQYDLYYVENGEARLIEHRIQLEFNQADYDALMVAAHSRASDGVEWTIVELQEAFLNLLVEYYDTEQPWGLDKSGWTVADIPVGDEDIHNGVIKP